MILSKPARAERKKVQLARLAAKADPDTDYPTFYANQGVQKAKAEINGKIRDARALLRQAKTNFEVARVTGVNIDAAESAILQATAAISGLIAIKSARFKPNDGAVITAGA